MSDVKLEKVYMWRYISNDGLLKEHPPVGPYYDDDSLMSEYSSEEDAVKDLIRFQQAHEYAVEREMVLLTVYRKVYQW